MSRELEVVISTKVTKKTHFSHPEHELELKNYQKPYCCDGCKEQGYGPRYRCELCDFDLHKECMFPSLTTSHEFFQGSTFKFFNQTPAKCSKRNCKENERCCDACGMDINGFVYHCEEKGWDLHPCCRNLEKEIEMDGVNFQLCNKVSKKCSFCKKKKLPNGVQGWSYVSKSDNYHFHVYCTMQMVVESWKNWPKDNNCLALENLELPVLQANSFGSGGKGGKFLRIVMAILRSIVAVLLGDPTLIILSTAIELLPLP
jgi:hypothetical protein